jgi:hypothetical protein
MSEAIACVRGNAEESLQEINDCQPISPSRAQRLISSDFSHSLLTLIDKVCIAAGGTAFGVIEGMANQHLPRH